MRNAVVLDNVFGRDLRVRRIVTFPHFHRPRVFAVLLHLASTLDSHFDLAVHIRVVGDFFGRHVHFFI
jgi:hypothetical protein